MAEERPVLHRRRSRTNSIFASAWSLITGAEDEEGATDQPDGNKTEFHLSREDAWMQASYTAVAFMFIFITGCMFVAVYYILEPFLQPLLWAVLVGFVVHPLKNSGTTNIHNWLEYLDTSGIPLSVGVVLSPLYAFNWLAQLFEHTFFSNWKTLLVMLVCMVAIPVSYVYNLPLYLVRSVQYGTGLMDVVKGFMEHTVWLQVCSLLLGFVLLLVMSNRSSGHTTALKALSACLWFLAFLNIGVYLIGSIAMPLVCSLFIAAVILSLANVNMDKQNTLKSGCIGKQTKSGDAEKVHLLERGISLETLRKLTSGESVLNVDIKGTEDEDFKETESAHENDDAFEERSTSPTKQVSFSPHTQVRGPSFDHSRSPSPPTYTCTDTKPVRPKLMKQGTAKSKKWSPRGSRGTDEVDYVWGLKRRAPPNMKSSDQVFFSLLTACLLVILWKYPILLLIPIPLTIWCVMKYAISLPVVKDNALIKLSGSLKMVQNWLISQERILFPWPLPTMYSMYLLLDRKVLEVVKKSTGSLMSAVIIVLLLLVVFTGMVFLVFQVQAEGMHYASTAVSVWNTTVTTNPQIKEWMGAGEGNESLVTSLESFASQNYHHARETLVDWIQKLVGDSSANTTVMEQRVLELFDRLYSVYVVQNATSFIDAHPTVEEPSTDQSVWWTFTELLPLINTSTAVSVLKSVWSVLSDNLALGFSFLYTLLQLLFSGGTVLINAIVFLSTLFYLLSYSERNYLPIKWLAIFPSDLTASTPSGVKEENDGEGDYGKLFSRTIRSVFHATLRRACFYGLYTWLIHTLFGLRVSILPAVLAGVAGAIPFIGAYWVALPAVLELWLLEGQLLSAITLFTLSLLPLFFVDTLINREIEGGHPYLTGLAIAGGIYFAGLEGALIGPILLSCLLFVIDFYDESFV